MKRVEDLVELIKHKRFLHSAIAPVEMNEHLTHRLKIIMNTKIKPISTERREWRDLVDLIILIYLIYVNS